MDYSFVKFVCRDIQSLQKKELIMSTIELKSEVIRLVNEMDEDLMEDLLLSIKVFVEKQVPNEIDTNSPDLVKSLKESLGDVEQSTLLSNAEILKETQKWLSK